MLLLTFNFIQLPSESLHTFTLNLAKRLSTSQLDVFQLSITSPTKRKQHKSPWNSTKLEYFRRAPSRFRLSPSKSSTTHAEKTQQFLQQRRQT
jgi:hypothetical protein